MVVTGLQIDDRTVMIEYLHAIADGLNEWDLVTDLKVIDTASIPVIKAHVNLRKLREKEFGKTDSSSTDSEGEGISSMLPIDITIDDLTPSMG